MCRYCGYWTSSDTGAITGVNEQKVVMLDAVEAVSIERIQTGGVWDQALGGGIVPSSAVLAGGAAGQGKTTMLLQIASAIARIRGRKSYFFSAEQAPGEIKLTAERLQIPNMQDFLVLASFGSGADIDEELLKKYPPAMFVVDSISALCGKDTHAALAIAKRYKQYSIKHQAPSFLICHMTKEHDYAGLMALQHEVDTLITIFREDSDRTLHKLLREGYPEAMLTDLRTLTPWKNRYGPTGQDYHLMMTAHGLQGLPPPPGKKEKKRPLLGVAPAVEAPVAPPAAAVAVSPSGLTATVTEITEARAARKEKAAAPLVVAPSGQVLVLRPKKKSAGGDETRAQKKGGGEALRQKRPPMPRRAKKDEAPRRRSHPAKKGKE